MGDAERILNHLRERGSITRWEAMKEYGIANPTARITDLRKQGHNIVTVTETGVDRFGDKTHWGRWYLKEDANAALRN